MLRLLPAPFSTKRGSIYISLTELPKSKVCLIYIRLSSVKQLLKRSLSSTVQTEEKEHSYRQSDFELLNKFQILYRRRHQEERTIKSPPAPPMKLNPHPQLQQAPNVSYSLVSTDFPVNCSACWLEIKERISRTQPAHPPNSAPQPHFLVPNSRYCQVLTNLLALRRSRGSFLC